jgi:predicted nucleic acid-binding Zn ribbon protein
MRSSATAKVALEGSILVHAERNLAQARAVLSARVPHMASRPPRARRKSARPEPVAKILPTVLDDVGLGATSATVQLLKVWDQALGEPFSAHCRPEGLRDGVVLARVRDSAWMQRLQLEKPRILERLAEALPEPPRDIRLLIGR